MATSQDSHDRPASVPDADAAALPRDVLHDFNNLFMGIIGCVDVVLGQLAEKPLRRYLTEVRQAALRGTALASQCLGHGAPDDEHAAPTRPRVVPEARSAIIVDSDPLARLTIRSHLEPLGFECIDATSVAALAQLLDAGAKAELLVVNAQLGADIARVDPHPPTIFTSAHSQAWLEREGQIEAGSVTVRTPIDRVALRAALRELLPL